jgi:hypothetical protein
VSDPGGAGITSTTLIMPKPLTIDVQHIPPVCSSVQQAAKSCPDTALIGNAVTTSPLLKKPLEGKVYALQSDPASGATLPRVLVALRGSINTDIIATNSFTPASQIVTKFNKLPDVPLSSFQIHIGNSFLTTRTDACTNATDTWNITGSLNAYNGATSAVNIPEKFNCPQAYGPTFTYSFKFKKKNKSTMSAVLSAQLGKKLKKATLTLPKGVKFNKKGLKGKKLAKLVIVKGDGKTLKPKCFKLSGSNAIVVNLCKKQVKTISFTFKAGSLIAAKKPKSSSKPKIKVQQSDGKTVSAVFMPE